VKTEAMRNQLRPAPVVSARLRSFAGIAAGAGYVWNTKQVESAVSDCSTHLTRRPMDIPT